MEEIDPVQNGFGYRDCVGMTKWVGLGRMGEYVTFG